MIQLDPTAWLDNLYGYHSREWKKLIEMQISKSNEWLSSLYFVILIEFEKKIQAMSNSVKVLSYSDQYTKHAAKVRTIAYDQLNTINQ